MKGLKEPSFRVETITPELAKAYLEANTHNRPISRATVAEYADAIREGHWLFNGEAIKFDWNEQLVDGQHRLGAIVKAGKAISILVIRNLDPEAFKTLDTGRKRSGGDVMALRGVMYSGAMSSAYRMLWRFLGGPSKKQISNTQLLELADRHPDLVERGYEAMKAPLNNHFYSHHHQIFFFYVAERYRPDLARRFLEELRRGDGKGNAKRLCDRLRQVEKEIIPPASPVRWSWLLQAWNATVKNVLVDRYSSSPGRIEFDPCHRLK